MEQNNQNNNNRNNRPGGNGGNVPGGVVGPTGRRLHVAHRRSPSELTPLVSVLSQAGNGTFSFTYIHQIFPYTSFVSYNHIFPLLDSFIL